MSGDVGPDRTTGARPSLVRPAGWRPDLPSMAWLPVGLTPTCPGQPHLPAGPMSFALMSRHYGYS